MNVSCEDHQSRVDCAQFANKKFCKKIAEGTLVQLVRKASCPVCVESRNRVKRAWTLRGKRERVERCAEAVEMSALFRVRVSSFLAGVGVTSLAYMVTLKQDIEHSYGLVMDAMREENTKLSERVLLLESLSSTAGAETKGSGSNV